jgi:hypothetical protein
MVHVTLADTHRYFFKARFGGSPAIEIPRDHAFCNYTILHNEVFVCRMRWQTQRSAITLMW